MSARQVPLFDGAAFELAVLAFEEAFRELQVATRAWVAGGIPHAAWYERAQSYGRTVKALRDLGGHQVVEDLIAGLRDRISTVRDPQSPQAHTPPNVVHHDRGAQSVGVGHVYPDRGPEHLDRCGVQSTSVAVVCAASPTSSDVVAAKGEEEVMARAQSIDLLARIEVLRARAEHHNAEARAAEVELAQLEVELTGCNPDAIDDGEMPIDEWCAYAATADEDPFARQQCRSCGRHVVGLERDRGFCSPCADVDDERQTRTNHNDNEESR
jgi:hypothetical protein